MTNGNRFAIYLSSFHLVDLWCTGETGETGDGFWRVNLKIQSYLTEGKRTAQLSALLCIVNLSELTKTRQLTFLAEGDKQAGESGVLHSISVQL